MVANTQNSVTDISPFNNQGELLQRTASGEQEGGAIMDQFYQAGYHMHTCNKNASVGDYHGNRRNRNRQRTEDNRWN